MPLAFTQEDFLVTCLVLSKYGYRIGRNLKESRLEILPILKKNKQTKNPEENQKYERKRRKENMKSRTKLGKNAERN